MARRCEPDPPDREADTVERWRTSTEQAALYRLSGDRNPGDELAVEAWLTGREGIAAVRSGDRAVVGPALASFA